MRTKYSLQAVAATKLSPTGATVELQLFLWLQLHGENVKNDLSPVLQLCSWRWSGRRRLTGGGCRLSGGGRRVGRGGCWLSGGGCRLSGGGCRVGRSGCC